MVYVNMQMSLCCFVLKLEEYIKHLKTFFHSSFESNEHFKWEFLKKELVNLQ